METKELYNTDLVDKLSALLMVMFAASETLLSEIEKEIAKGRCRMKHEPKMLIGELLRNGKRMHAIYDRLCELSVNNGTTYDGTEVADAFLTDKNFFLRFFMMAQNAMHGDTDIKKQVQLESLLKLLAKQPSFDQAYIDRLTNIR